MRSDRSRRSWRVISFGLLLILSVPLLRCEGKPTEIAVCVDIESFRAAAREASCAELRNELFMIDRHLVFWQVESNSCDAYWQRILYGCTLDDMLCRDWCAFACPLRVYVDSSYQRLFETILANRDRRDLGLRPFHEVVPIRF